jgi:hypothetical protein
MTVLSNRVRQWLRISPRRKRAKVLLDEDIGWLIHEYEHAYPNEEEGQGPFGYLSQGRISLRDGGRDYWRASS